MTFTGTLAAGSQFPTAGETITVTLDGISEPATIGSGGSFTTSSFDTSSLHASATPYDVAYAYTSDGVFLSASGVSQLTVNPLAVQLSGSRAYNATNAAAFSILTVANVQPGDTVTVAAGTATLAGKGVGAQTITDSSGLTLGGPSAGDYTLTGATGSVSISALHITGAFTVANKTYDGNASANVLTRSLVGALNGDDVSLTGGTASFADRNAGNGKTVTLTGATLGGPDASNYALVSVATTTASIARANATISLSPYTATYNGAAHTATGAATGVLGESLAGLDLGATSHVDAGSYTDAWTFTDSSGNYNNASGMMSDSIARANATISVAPYNVTYDGAVHTATGTATGAQGQILGGLDLSGTSHANPGTYSDHWTFADTTGNYNNAGGTVSDSIGKAPLTIVADSLGKTYGNAVSFNGSEFTESGLLDGDSVAGVALTSSGATASASVGSYPITASDAVGSGLGHYNITYIPGTLTVTQTGATSTTTTFVTSGGASVFVQLVPLTVQVTSLVPGGAIPSGAVLFSIDGSPIGTTVINATGQATLNTAGIPLGSHSVVATYLGGAGLSASQSGPISWQVNPDATSSGLGASAVRNSRGKITSVILTAQVGALPPGGGGPTGIVTFYRGGRPLAVKVLTASSASVTLKADQILGKKFWVEYGGDNTFQGSVSAKLKVRAANLASASVRSLASRIGHAGTRTVNLGRASLRMLARAMGLLPPAHDRTDR